MGWACRVTLPMNPLDTATPPPLNPRYGRREHRDRASVAGLVIPGCHRGSVVVVMS